MSSGLAKVTLFIDDRSRRSKKPRFPFCVLYVQLADKDISSPKPLFAIASVLFAIEIFRHGCFVFLLVTGYR